VVADLVTDLAAVYRLVRLLQRDQITEQPRNWFVRHYGAERHGIAWSALADCPWCLSIWVAAGVVLARAGAPRLWGMAARGLAFSAGAGVISELVGRLESDAR
jgi:hypothetical protein